MPIELLVPYARNARTHDDAQVAQIMASIVEFGVTNAGLWDRRTIVAAHGRIMAVSRLYAAGKTLYHAPGEKQGGAPIPLGTYPMKNCAGWTDAQKQAYILADNQLALNAGWNEELLKIEVAELHAAGFALPLIGFDADQLKELLAPPATEGLTDADEEVAEPTGPPVSREGDVWLLGPHRITCGDSTDADVVARALNGETPHLMCTDPPYGVEYDANWRNEAERADGSKIGASAIGKVENDTRADWREAWALFPGDVVYVWHAGLFAGVVAESLEACGFKLRSQIVWAKSNFAIGRGDYHWHHEPCWYAVKNGATGHWAAGRDQSTLWSIAKPAKSETGHSTQKPVECMKRPIENNSAPGDHVYEPFSGSGTTIIACEMTGRIAHAIELNPAYVDVAVTRWEKFTGKAATLESDGRTFAEVLAERRPAGAITAKVA